MVPTAVSMFSFFPLLDNMTDILQLYQQNSTICINACPIQTLGDEDMN